MKLAITCSKKIGQRLTKIVEKLGATVSRIGGDEFVVMFETNNIVKDVSEMAQCLLDNISNQIVLDSHEIVVTSSMGISVYPADGEDGKVLLKNADTALSRAKADGKNTYQFFTTKMNEVALERLILENQLRKVLSQNELRVYYQPQVEANTGKIIGTEALIRWQHPELGLVSPTKFIPVAEEMGLIIPIGEWVLRTACKQNKIWQQSGFPPLRISVNMSSRQFQSDNLLQIVKNALTDSQLNPIYLELELTESVLMAEESDEINNIISLLTELRSIGIKIAIDDFGTGYSSLSYLKRFPVNSLKIDRSFVKDIPIDNDDAAITRAIIALAHSLRLYVIAEGVETLEQLEFLQNQQCEIIQGYYFSTPLCTEDMTKMLEDSADKALC